MWSSSSSVSFVLYMLVARVYFLDKLSCFSNECALCCLRRGPHRNYQKWLCRWSSCNLCTLGVHRRLSSRVAFGEWSRFKNDRLNVYILVRLQRLLVFWQNKCWVSSVLLRSWTVDLRMVNCPCPSFLFLLLFFFWEFSILFICLFLHLSFVLWTS